MRPLQVAVFVYASWDAMSTSMIVPVLHTIATKLTAALIVAVDGDAAASKVCVHLLELLLMGRAISRIVVVCICVYSLPLLYRYP